MQAKIEQKNKAIELRKQGFSYAEILKKIPVAKSSLSLWLRSVGLSKKQEQRLTDKKLASALRGSKKRKEIRIALTNEIKRKAQEEVGNLTERELWLISTALYWAEGSKEKNYRPGSGVQFSNSDPRMIRLFLSWLLGTVDIPKEDIGIDIYIHESHKNTINRVINYWAEQINFSRDNFQHIYFKKNKIDTKRKNTGKDYYGLLRVRVKGSSILNRRISGWIDGFCKNY
ncbi:MAG: hypothetical protein NT155_04620 [Candidatus Staskawiczbacteria bacterium]|nr:hypothetical protein [Candidatus Staskawiczbacteria bacterium]